jgi:hypothetical protein
VGAFSGLLGLPRPIFPTELMGISCAQVWGKVRIRCDLAGDKRLLSSGQKIGWDRAVAWDAKGNAV